MMPPVAAVAIALLLTNVTSFVTFALDKRYARAGQRRIPERTLLACGLAGPLGAWLGVAALRHKTRKPWFLGRLALASAVLPALLWAAYG